MAQARAVFDSPRQKLLVVCDGTRYVGAIRRGGLDGAGDAATIDGLVDPGVPTMGPQDPSVDIPGLVERSGLSRIPVVAADGEFLGLVCFNPSAATYCVG